MSHWKGCLFGLAAIALLQSAATVLSKDSAQVEDDPFDVYNECGNTYECIAYAGRKGVVFYEQPNPTARILTRGNHGAAVLLLQPATKVLNSEWVATAIATEGPKGPYTRKVRAWVRRADVILNTDFRRVVRCWPVRFMGIPEQGFENMPQAVFFTPAGLASAWDPDADERGPNAGFLRAVFKDYGIQHTYYAEGVFTVRHEKYANRGLYHDGTVDYTKHVATYAGALILKGKQVQWFPSETLKGCKEIPTVDDVPAPTPREFLPHSG